MFTPRFAQALVLVASHLVVSTDVATAQFGSDVHISSAAVDPTGIITPADFVSLNVFLESGYAEIELFSPTQVQTIGNDIVVDIFAESGMLTILDFDLETVQLGSFPPGTYSYLVTQRGPSMFGQAQVSGTFQVVPEPASAILGFVGLLLPICRRRAIGVPQ